MIPYFTHRKGETRFCEDSLTASVFGLLQYLPSDIFWSILKRSLLHDKLPYAVGELQHIGFWEKWNPTETRNSKYVEPDVLLRYQEFDIILEAKRYDSSQQSHHQMEDQIRAYQNVYGLESKSLIFIQVGGLHSFVDEVDYRSAHNLVPICKTDWSRLLSEVYRESEQLKNSGLKSVSAQIRILDNVMDSFNMHQFYKMDWLENLTRPQIESKSFKSFFTYV